MYYRVQRFWITTLCLATLAFSPIWGREGGGFRGGAPRGPGGPAPHAAPGHVGGPAGPHGGVGIHGGPGAHPVGANHFGGVHGGPGPHYERMIHQPGPHWNGYHQAFVGNHPVHLAWAGYRPSYYYHPWYHGPWGGHAWGWGWGFGPGVTFGLAGSGWGVSVGNGWGYPAYYGPYGAYGYWGRPLGWGFGGWGLGTTVYSSGYYSYYNPYYSPAFAPVVVYDYSRPIQVATQMPPGAPPVAATAPPTNLYDGSSPSPSGPQVSQAPSAPPLDNPAFDMARDAFKRGDYAMAIRHADAAIRKSPHDAVMHEFRSLTLFALRDYRQSAAVAHSVLAVGPGWDYTTMSSLYADPFVYSEQLRNLEQYAHDHPRATEAHFLLAYHQMIGSHKEAAAAELQQVVRLMPNDRLAAELLTMVQGPPKTAAPTPSPGSLQDSPPAPPAEDSNLPTGPVASDDPPPIEKDRLPGTWNASREDGSKFRLTLTSDGKFTWKYSTTRQGGEEFTGTYSTDGPVLILERKEGGALTGTARFADDRQMNFKLVGGPPEDKGLDFARN